MRQRKLKRLWRRLHELQCQKLTRDQLLIKLVAAKKEAGKAYALVAIRLPTDDADLNTNGLGFSLRKDTLRRIRRREGRYLLRSNLTGSDPAMLWEYHIQLTEIEQAFKELKSDLAIRRSTIKRMNASKYIFLSPSSRTACRLRSNNVPARWRRD